MARRRTRRYYRKKGKWSANIKTLTNQTISTTPSSSFYGTSTLCTNPVQTDSSVSQQYTVKNIELSYEIEYTGSSVGNDKYIEGLTVYVMYVPQGMTVTETYPNNHPEYIMAYKFLGSPNSDATGGNGPSRNPLKIKTRMARRLQTGDSVILLIVGRNETSNAVPIEFNGLVRWWTKAN